MIVNILQSFTDLYVDLVVPLFDFTEALDGIYFIHSPGIPSANAPFFIFVKLQGCFIYGTSLQCFKTGMLVKYRY